MDSTAPLRLDHQNVFLIPGEMAQGAPNQPEA